MADAMCWLLTLCDYDETTPVGIYPTAEQAFDALRQRFPLGVQIDEPSESDVYDITARYYRKGWGRQRADFQLTPMVVGRWYPQHFEPTDPSPSQAKALHAIV